MPRPLPDTDTDALIFGSNSETDEENGSNYDLMKMKKTQLLTMIQNKHLRRKNIQDLLVGDPI